MRLPGLPCCRRSCWCVVSRGGAAGGRAQVLATLSCGQACVSMSSAQREHTPGCGPWRRGSNSPALPGTPDPQPWPSCCPPGLQLLFLALPGCDASHEVVSRGTVLRLLLATPLLRCPLLGTWVPLCAWPLPACHCGAHLSPVSTIHAELDLG